MKFNEGRGPWRRGKLVITAKVWSSFRCRGVPAGQNGNYTADDRTKQRRGPWCKLGLAAALSTPLAVLSPSINPSLSSPSPSLCHSHCSSCAHPPSPTTISYRSPTFLKHAFFCLFPFGFQSFQSTLFIFSSWSSLHWPVSLPFMIYHSIWLVQFYMYSVVISNCCFFFLLSFGR